MKDRFKIEAELLEVLKKFEEVAMATNSVGQVKHVYPSENINVDEFDEAISIIQENYNRNGKGFHNHNFEVKGGFNVMLLID